MSSLAGVTLYLEQDTGWVSTPRFAALDVLDSTSTSLHYLSAPSSRRSITGTILGSPGDYDSLVTAARAHVAVSFVGDVDSGQCYILNISGQRAQNVAEASASANFVMRVTAELMEA
jgi:hypothetical protein